MQQFSTQNDLPMLMLAPSGPILLVILSPKRPSLFTLAIHVLTGTTLPSSTGFCRILVVTLSLLQLRTPTPPRLLVQYLIFFGFYTISWHKPISFNTRKTFHSPIPRHASQLVYSPAR
jgi:hypothetical protein